ncbi:hypothetical protein EYF80_010887 [Liparis tanakae]|uniref:Uncharacterized protein n=1 Tax=Liparis tanakae TaxID=230148 RepID=A0A4Z2IME7_9TELE|nr:hypothetical protein EYF80_010887 [Liparis tanakae]
MCKQDARLRLLTAFGPYALRLPVDSRHLKENEGSTHLLFHVALNKLFSEELEMTLHNPIDRRQMLISYLPVHYCGVTKQEEERRLIRSRRYIWSTAAHGHGQRLPS